MWERHPQVFSIKCMSTLANESILETFYEDALAELDVNELSPFFADACKIAEQIAMDKFLSNNH